MKSAEPWITLPPEYKHTTRNPRPQFSYGLGITSLSEFKVLAIALKPSLKSKIEADPNLGPIVVTSCFDYVCGLFPCTIQIEFTDSKEAQLVLSLGNTHEDFQPSDEVKRKFEESLRIINWKNQVLKWYITDESFRSKEDWSTPKD